jgi:hypothetical protein
MFVKEDKIDDIRSAGFVGIGKAVALESASATDREVTTLVGNPRFPVPVIGVELVELVSAFERGLKVEI